MYSTFAYYPSPIDGNLYPVYTYNSFGQLELVHFQLDSTNRIQLVNIHYSSGYPSVQSINIFTDTGLSNLVFFQPSLFGASQLRYCYIEIPFQLTLMMNVSFQKFEPIFFDQNNFMPIFPQQQQQHFHSYQMQNPQNLPVQGNENILPTEINIALQAMQSQQLNNLSINMQSSGFNLSAEDHHGNRYVLEKHSKNGIHERHETMIEPSDNIKTRLEKVKHFRQLGMTQNEIALRIGVSQKTVSNDLQQLNLS